jgi:hypothetical protein
LTIRLPADRLYRRTDDIASLVSPLVSNKDLFSAVRLSQVRDYTVSYLPKGYAEKTVLDPSSLRLKTQWDEIYFNYHEIWVPQNTSHFFTLERSYLHLYLRGVEGFEELQALSLHCDPDLDPNDTSFRYKRGPHFHVGGSNPNIDRAHLSLCVSDAALGGNNLGALMRTLKDSLGLVVNELIPQYV